ncbi:MAG: hypothetical protein JF606_28025 [Burkholderiales bacterium]|nr:hypothetical protein [Burkholderiales bacterium]
MALLASIINTCRLRRANATELLARAIATIVLCGCDDDRGAKRLRTPDSAMPELITPA